MAGFVITTHQTLGEVEGFRRKSDQRGSVRLQFGGVTIFLSTDEARNLYRLLPASIEISDGFDRQAQEQVTT